MLAARRLALIGSLSALLAGCASSTGNDIEAAGAAVVAGNAVSGFPYDAVGSVHLGGDRRLACSGTLVAPDAMVTAAHCVEFWPANEISVQFRVSATGARTTDFLDVAEAHLHPDFDGSEPNDIAVLRLAADVPNVAPIGPLPAALVFDASDIDALELDIVGYGADQEGEIGTRNSKLLTLGGLGCTVAGCPSDLRDFTELVSYAQLDGGPCALDSGGPALVQRDDQVYLGAVTIDGDAACTLWGVSVSIAPFTEWIEGVVGEPLGNDGGTVDPGAGGDGSVGTDMDAGVVEAPGVNSGAASGSCAAAPSAREGAWVFALLGGAVAWRRRCYSSTRT